MVDNRGAVFLRAYRDAHRLADTDGDSASIHHTLGVGPNQAAKGNHYHWQFKEMLGDEGPLSYPIGRSTGFTEGSLIWPSANGTWTTVRPHPTTGLFAFQTFISATVTPQYWVRSQVGEEGSSTWGDWRELAPAFTEVGRISKNAQQNLPNATLTQLTFQTAEKNTPAGFADVANNRLVFPATGQYYVEAQLRVAAAAGGDRWLGLALNGSYFKGAGTPTSVSNTITGFVTLSFRYDFLLGDILTASGLQNSGAALQTSTATDNTYILAERVG